MRTQTFALALGAALLAAPSAESGAGDPLTLYPENYRVLLENERVRVLDFRLARGAREQLHSHPAHLAVFLEDFTIRFTLPDGSTALREGRPHRVAWSDGATHASENIGESDAHGILVELKEPPACAAR
jgi:quercetin dioxygenase-like cupin family protein